MLLDAIDTPETVQELRQFVTQEFDAQWLKFQEDAARPLKERMERGTCLGGLIFHGVDARGNARFRHAGNDSRLREGDMVRLSQDAPLTGIQASIYREEPGELWLWRESGFSAETFASQIAGWVIDEDVADLREHYFRAFDELLRSQIGQERILPLLEGSVEPTQDDEVFAEVLDELDEVAAEGKRWEEAQETAIAGAVAAEHCYLVQGPPGTGKTHVLAEVAARLVERGERVLVTAFTHRAIDNALEAVAKRVGDRTKVARLQAPTHRRGEGYETYEHFEQSPLFGTSGWVVGATPFALRKRVGNGIQFDTIIIDEAGQMTTALAVMAMLWARKYVFFGDQQQLGPVVVSRSRRDARDCGIFHTLKLQELEGSMLDVTYRLNDTLARWPSENFYNGDLVSAGSAAKRRLAWNNSAAPTETSLKEALVPESPFVWIDTPADDSTTVNHAEVVLATELLQGLVGGGVRHAEIAVVTPYRRQAREIRNRLDQMHPSRQWRECIMDTVERMQGQEREVIILSLCAANVDFVARPQQFEFLFDPRRLNVSATRARTKLIILGSVTLTSLHSDNPEEHEDIMLLRSLREAAVRVTPSA